MRASFPGARSPDPEPTLSSAAEQNVQDPPHPPAVRRMRAERLVSLLKALSHPLRLRLFELLCVREEHVGALAERLGAPQHVVSQQLRILRWSSLVAVTRARGGAVYRVQAEAARDILRLAERCGSVAATAAVPPAATAAAMGRVRVHRRPHPLDRAPGTASSPRSA